MKTFMANPAQKTVYIITGPTAVGKTTVALKAAQAFATSVISADSRQCYREMSIGTAKPSPEELREVKHYFIDEFPVTEHVTAADFERLALQYLNGIFETNDNAIVCGGTGLYIKALTEGLDEMPAVETSVEAALIEEYALKGLSWLQEVVKDEDPGFFSLAEVQNPARLLRALAFKRSTGKSITEYRTGKKKGRSFRIIKCALNLPRAELYRRIDHRVDLMMEQGLLEEVQSLYPLRHLKNLQTVGYSELFDYLDGKCSLEAAVDKIRQHTRNYAKRQLTWFRKDPEMHWLDVSDSKIIGQIRALK